MKKFDHAGGEIWSATYNNTNKITNIIEAQTGGYWLSIHDNGGSTSCVSHSQNNKIIRVDRNGNELARISFPQICFSALLNIVEISPDVCVGFGRGAIEQDDLGAFEPGTGHFYSFELEYTENNPTSGSITTGDFKLYLPGQDVDEAYKIIQTEDGFLCGGYHGNVLYDAQTNMDIWQQRAMLMKLDENRDSVWTRFYSSFIPDVYGLWRKHAITDFKPTPDGGYVCVGWMRHNNLLEWPPLLRGTHSAYALKVDEHGCLEPGCQYVGVDEMAIDMRGSLKAYPNPATNYLRVKLDIPQQAAQNGPVELVMHDLQGRVVYRQNHPELQFGEVSIDVSQFPSGLYTLHCTVNGVWVDGQKVMVE